MADEIDQVLCGPDERDAGAGSGGNGTRAFLRTLDCHLTLQHARYLDDFEVVRVADNKARERGWRARGQRDINPGASSSAFRGNTAHRRDSGGSAAAQ
ncbi:hypothetical protein KEH56_36620 [Burkholderia cenocepacia]|uniref:hypothetical protein n=1 Tax=Burkholderia cenocepacia TaxID=95486 RepID=UPI001BABF053|nr:hypothetical protein [Burkholderia cenocepacia]QUN44697.1 hypothetical protein KEH56_36620 [Burkholderia cenocepacia]